MVAPTSLLAVLQWRLSHGVPEREERSFSLAHRHIRSVTQLMALLHQASRRLARGLGPASYLHWKLRAAVEVSSDTVGQVCVAPRAPVSTDAELIDRGNLAQVELSCATSALSESEPRDEKPTTLINHTPAWLRPFDRREGADSCTVRGGRLPLCPGFRATDSFPAISSSIVPSRM